MCPYCCLSGKSPNLTRYHFDNCKLNPKNLNNILGNFSILLEHIDKRKEIFECPYCKKQGQNIGNMKRWHFDNCKEKNR